MYAVIQTGGKQYRVQEGDVLRVASLGAEAGKKVSFDDVLLVGEGDAIKIGADAARSTVAAEVLAHGLGKKMEIFKKRRRKHSQRTQGHRQAYTSVRITKIGEAKTKPMDKKPAAATAKDAVTEAKKPAVKAASGKQAAAKPTSKPAASGTEKSTAKSKGKE